MGTLTPNLGQSGWWLVLFYAVALNEEDNGLVGPGLINHCLKVREGYLHEVFRFFKKETGLSAGL